MEREIEREKPGHAVHRWTESKARGCRVGLQPVDCQRPWISAFIIWQPVRATHSFSPLLHTSGTSTTTSQHNEANNVPGKHKPTRKHTNTHTHIRVFACHANDCQRRQKKVCWRVYDLFWKGRDAGCLSRRMHSSNILAQRSFFWYLITADVNNAVLIMAVMKTESVSHGLICKRKIIKTKVLYQADKSERQQSMMRDSFPESSCGDAGLSFVSWLVALWH